MAESGIMNYLMKDEELCNMRRKWKILGVGKPFPPYNYDEYNGVTDYKNTVRKILESYEKGDS